MKPTKEEIEIAKIAYYFRGGKITKLPPVEKNEIPFDLLDFIDINQDYDCKKLVPAVH